MSAARCPVGIARQAAIRAHVRGPFYRSLRIRSGRTNGSIPNQPRRLCQRRSPLRSNRPPRQRCLHPRAGNPARHLSPRRAPSRKCFPWNPHPGNGADTAAPPAARKALGNWEKLHVEPSWFVTKRLERDRCPGDCLRIGAKPTSCGIRLSWHTQNIAGFSTPSMEAYSHFRCQDFFRAGGQRARPKNLGRGLGKSGSSWRSIHEIQPK